jgi:DMSO/TMAO reductase YedYZ heme-binding membrane subunit
MKLTVRVRFWLEAGVASLAGFLAVLTLFWRDWIEATSGLDPDRHSGSLEWAIVAGLFLICVTLSVVARAEWRRPRALLSSRS